MTNNPVAEAITEYWGERCSDYEPNCPCCEAWAQYDAMTSTSAEPVAYQVAMSDGRWGTIFHHPDKPLGDHRPLYVHPPNAELERCKANPTTRGLNMTPQINAEDFYDYVAAEKEGWFISYAPGNLDETIWRLERRDANPVFLGGDPEAHTHVVKRALEGSKLHQDALDFLRTYEPREYEIVLRHATATERDQSHAQAVTATDLVAVNECVEMVDELYDSVLASKARQELDVLTPTLAQAAAAAMEMRKRAADESCYACGSQDVIRTMPIDPDAQKALDRMLIEAEQRGYANAMEAERKDADQRISKAREDAIRLSASIAEAWKAFDGEDYRPVEAAILALLTDGG